MKELVSKDVGLSWLAATEGNKELGRDNGDPEDDEADKGPRWLVCAAAMGV